jgi:hypothetical protein
MAKVAGPSVLAVLMFPVTPTMAVVFVQVVLLERTAHKVIYIMLPMHKYIVFW